MSELYFKKYLKYKQKYFNKVYGGMNTPSILNTTDIDSLKINIESLKIQIDTKISIFTTDINTLCEQIKTTLVPKLDTICKSNFPPDAMLQRPWTQKDFLIDKGYIPNANKIVEILKQERNITSQNKLLQSLFEQYNNYIEYIFKTIPYILNEINQNIKTLYETKQKTDKTDKEYYDYLLEQYTKINNRLSTLEIEFKKKQEILKTDIDEILKINFDV